jgi:uncharacterized protein with GYD domain
MPSYVMLMKLTAAGAARLEESPARIAAAKDAFASLGGEVTSFHITMGEYDFVAVGELPNDLCAMAFAAVMAKSGAVSVTTMKGFSEEQWPFILDADPELLIRGAVVTPYTGKAGRKTLTGDAGA